MVVFLRAGLVGNRVRGLVVKVFDEDSVCDHARPRMERWRWRGVAWGGVGMSMGMSMGMVENVGVELTLRWFFFAEKPRQHFARWPHQRCTRRCGQNSFDVC